MIGSRIVLILVSLSLHACMSDQFVTMRPEFAYPQNLQSLCGDETYFKLKNIGSFHTDNWGSDPFGRLLLSSQFLGEPPETQRKYDLVQLQISPGTSIRVTAFDKLGQQRVQDFGKELVSCNTSGELIVKLPSSSQYFWATMGFKDRQLALWTNQQGELVVHNRWKESIRGVIGYSSSGDAWAIFDPYGQAPPELLEATQGIAADPAVGAECAILNGSFDPNSNVVHLDGSLAVRTATEQFFRPEIIGEHPVNQERIFGTHLQVVQGIEEGIDLVLWDGEQQLVVRHIEAAAIRCEANRWLVEGEKEWASGWLLLTGSAGASWEDLLLWQDETGDLLVEGIHKGRHALFLIPLVQEDRLFMAFNRLKN